MTSHYWFRAKEYGWGWYPATIQGWFVTVFYILINLYFFVRIDEHSHSASDTIMTLFPWSLLMTIIFIAVCAMTGEKAKWRWGNKS